MTTLLEAQEELVDLLVADDIRAVVTPAGDPPYVAVVHEGIDLGHLLRGAGLARFALRCVAGAWDADATVRDLATLKLACLQAVRQVTYPGHPVEVRRDGIRSIGGADLLTADVIVERSIDL